MKNNKNVSKTNAWIQYNDSDKQPSLCHANALNAGGTYIRPWNLKKTKSSKLSEPKENLNYNDRFEVQTMKENPLLAYITTIYHLRRQNFEADMKKS